MACKMLGMEQIPAIVNRVDDEKSAVFALIENLQRKDLNYFEEAQGIQTLMQTSGMSQQEVAKKLGKAQSTVANKLRLLFFGEDLRQKMLDNGLTERHARALLRLPNERLVNEAIQYIVAERLNVGESESYIESLLTAVPEKPPSKPATRLFVVKDLRIFMNTITKAVSTMRLAGIEVDTSKEEDEEYIHYLVKIPKKSAYRSSHSAWPIPVCGRWNSTPAAYRLVNKFYTRFPVKKPPFRRFFGVPGKCFMWNICDFQKIS